MGIVRTVNISVIFPPSETEPAKFCLVWSRWKKKVENSRMKALYFEVRASGLKVAKHKKVSEVFLFIVTSRSLRLGY